MNACNQIIQGDRSFEAYVNYCKAADQANRVLSESKYPAQTSAQRVKEAKEAYENNLYQLSEGKPSELESVKRFNADDYNVFLHRKIEEQKRKRNGSD